MAISGAVVCHKWAEGLTLGIAFRKAGVDLKMSTTMICIQLLVTGIVSSISVGTFVYIATMEVIVEEFNL